VLPVEIGEDHVDPPLLECLTLYPVILDPLLLGAVHVSDTCAFPAVPETPVGAFGTVA
jgi:hypothetical protein